MSTSKNLYKRYKDLFISKRSSIFSLIKRSPKRSLNDFIIKKEIESGFSGVVYLASPRIDPDFNVAIKVLNKNNSHSQRELKFHKKLKSDYVVKFYEYFTDSHDNLYIVMEYAPLGDVCDKLLRETFLSEDVAKPIIRDICLAIKYFHDKNIVHGDIKKENVLIFDDCCKLIDFGLSFYESFNGDILGGTFGYIAPEIAGQMWHLCGRKIDIWSLGVLTFELLTGYSPFISVNSAFDLQLITDNIQSGKCHIPRYISQDAQNFIATLLQFPPTSRPTIDKVLTHKWLNC